MKQLAKHFSNQYFLFGLFIVGIAFFQYSLPVVRAQWVVSGDKLVTSPGITGVGVNTQTPRSEIMLHVAGNESMTPGLGRSRIQFEDIGTEAWTFNAFGSASIEGGGKFGINQVGRGHRLIIDRNGNIGIGTSNPQARLDVQGSLKLSSPGGVPPLIVGTIYYDSARGKFQCAELVSGSPLWVDCTGAGAGSGLFANGIPIVGSLARFTSNNQLASSIILENATRVTVAGDVEISGIFKKSGAAGLNRTCSSGQALSGQVVAGGIITGGTCADITGGGPSSAGNGWMVSGVSVVTDTSISQVGIGAGTPLAMLHLSGNENSAVGQNRAAIRLQDSSPGGGSWTINSFGRVSLEGAGKFGINQVGGGTRFVIDNNGRVGIGTTNPTARLEVSGNGSREIKLRDQSGVPGSVDIFVEIGNQIGDSLCRSGNSNAVCLAAWTSGGSSVACTANAQRALCTTFGD